MSAAITERHIYGMALQIRFTLLALYGALVLPLPFMAPPSLRLSLWTALVVGLMLTLAFTSEQIVLDGIGLQLTHPSWCSWWLRRGWQLRWEQVQGLTPVATSQGGRVFYVRTVGDGSQAKAYLLPQRVERFDDFLNRFSTLSHTSTDLVTRITPAWTYQVLAALSVALLIGEVVALATFKRPLA